MIKIINIFVKIFFIRKEDETDKIIYLNIKRNKMSCIICNELKKINMYDNSWEQREIIREYYIKKCYCSKYC